MVPGIVYSGSWTILLDELEMYQFFATLSLVHNVLTILSQQILIINKNLFLKFIIKILCT